MSKMDELVELIYRARSGDSEAFGTIVERFQDMAYGYAYAFLNDFSQAEDASQEAFIEAYYSLPSLREARAFPAWYKRIVFKHCDRLTRAQRPLSLPLDTDESLASPTPGPDEITERNEVRTRVRQAIGELPLNEWIAITLFYIDGYSHHEIADFLEVPAQTVKSRLHASRKRLKERMLDMVQEELNANALPEGFTHQTVEEAVLRARALNDDQQFTQSEQLMRQALTQAPGNPAVLKELNRALMRGKVYGEGRWDLLPDLAQQGQVILQTSEDKEVYRQMAHTLLAIPAMQEAISFLENWISKKGPNPERTGMLAWAKGCVGDYAAAENLWQEYLELARELEPGDRVNSTRFVCYTLVDCLAEAGDKYAGEKKRAQRITQQGWETCWQLFGAPREGISTLDWKRILDDWAWLRLLKQAGLDCKEAGQTLLARVAGKPDPESQGTALSIRAYLDDPEAVVKDWLAWVRERINQKEWKLIETFRFAVGIPLQQMGRWEARGWLAQATWEMLGGIEDPEAQKVRRPWGWERFSPIYFHLEHGNWSEAEQLAGEMIAGLGLAEGAWARIVLAALQGQPMPRDLVEVVEKEGVASVDNYGIAGWYLVAREAAAAGDLPKAFEALRKSVFMWSNPPYSYSNWWLKDPYWGELREHPEFERIFEEKRERIGPIYGELHYFPGW